MNRSLLVIVSILATVAVAIGIAFGVARIFAPSAPDVTARAPVVTGVTPFSAAAGATRVSVTISGTDFQTGAYLRFSRPGQPDLKLSGFSVTSDTTISGGVVDLTSAAPGAWDAVVTNPDGMSFTCAGCFTVGKSGTVPRVTSLSVASGAQGVSTTLVVVGENFEDGASVSLSGTGITITRGARSTATSLELTVSISEDAPLGARALTVTNPSLGSASCENCFTVTAGAPSAISVTPSTHGVGATGRRFELRGSRFVAGAKLSFSSPGFTVANTVVTSPTTIAATLSIASSTTPGAYDIIVSNPDGRSATCADCFTVSQAPVAAAVQPTSLLAGASTTVLITGSGFQRDAILALGAGVTIENMTFVDAGQLTARVVVAPTALAGPRIATVTNPDGGSTSIPNLFSVTRQTTTTTPTTTVTTTTTTTTTP